MSHNSILLISSHKKQLTRLKKLVNRKHIPVHFSESPENGLFLILNENISSVLVDLMGLYDPIDDFLSSLFSLDQELEIILISNRAILESLPLKYLRRCFGILTPGLRDKRDFLCINQLIEKITLVEKLKNLEDSSISDGLTGLFNHAFIQRTLEQEVRSALHIGYHLSLIFLDIDNFKNFNDTNGHPEGDIVLKKISKILTASIRKIDFAARYGGEEFVVLLPGTGLSTAVNIADRIRQNIEGTHFKHGEKQPLGFVSASFGVASLTRPEITSKKSLLFHADQALYCAKDHGRNQVWYTFEGAYQPLKPKKTNRK
jgi:diguanylate cyclase (GGDEF)-like protein